MKKTLVSVLAAAAMVLGLASCDFLKNANDQDSGSWKGQSPKEAADDSEKGTVVLSYTGTAPTWSMWTGTNGQYLEPQPTASRKDGKLVWKFNLGDYEDNYGDASTENFVLYINSSDAKKDYRGRVCVYRDKKVLIDYAKAYEEIAAVGLVTITNNEPLSNSAFPTGDYTIQDIWPLDPKTDEDAKVGGLYIVNDNMVFKGINLAKDKSITFPVKAGKQIIGLYQPNRNKNYNEEDESTYNTPTAKQIKEEKLYDLDGDGTIEATRADALQLKLKDDASDKDVVKAYLKANKSLIYGYEFDVTKHCVKPADAVNSSVFGKYWFVKGTHIERYKTVDEEPETVDVVTGAIEK